jgi:cell division transport system ATP-binding protein
MPILEFRNVSKKFGTIEALKDVTFSVDEGEFVFLTGVSGAGKTTILRLLIHEFVPTSGEIVFDGVDVHKLKKSKVPKLRQSIGSVFQDYKLILTRTIFENIGVALAVKGVPRIEWSDRIEDVLSLVGLSDRGRLFPSQLSGGELQRAALARALVVNPKLIFADEPTGNLDAITADGIMELLKKINKEGKTVLVTTHNHAIVEKMGKRVIELNDGRISMDTKHHKKHN